MKQFCQNLLIEMEQQLDVIHSLEDAPLRYSEEATKAILPFLSHLKTQVSNHRFENECEEITFFKYLKPQFTHRLIYYNAIYLIESHKPHGSDRLSRRHYKSELEKLQQYCQNNYEFYRYYRTGNVHLDHRYFLRGRYDLCLAPDPLHFDADERFSTTHDSKVATIIANDQLQMYLERELIKLQNKASLTSTIEKHTGQKWTGSKVSLIELIYALHAEGVLNNGATDLKDAIAYFESVFDVDLGQFHRTFLEIRGRKNERTRFLSSLREKLLLRMDEADERG